ncbi:MAG: hypothetical protein P8J32_01745 [bacterium]|jgi:hypothetical protein|nr:hypothetical protein [bacterium]
MTLPPQKLQDLRDETARLLGGDNILKVENAIKQHVADQLGISTTVVRVEVTWHEEAGFRRASVQTRGGIKFGTSPA